MGAAETPSRLERRVSVGFLARFVHRTGDLGGTGEPGVRPLEGIRRQQRHQQRLAGAESVSDLAPEGSKWRPEVRLTGSWQAHGVELTVAGRVDVMRETAGEVRFVEIKTWRGDLDRIRRTAGAMHDAQAMMYAALWLRRTKLPEGVSLRVSVLYLHADDEARMREFVVTSDPEVVLRFAERTCAAYLDWLAAEERRIALRDAALAGLRFPHARFRAGQGGLARLVWRALRDREVLLAQAATGIGKTLAVLYGAARRLPVETAERLMYLTARGAGRALALEATERLNAEGAHLRAIELLARERMCPVPGTPCHADVCERARGHFDRLAAARDEALHAPEGGPMKNAGIFDRVRVRELADRHGICPAALQRDLARHCDVIVADVNFAFDPFARQREMIDQDDGGAILLVDEAHNLNDRACEMYSATLVETELRSLQADGLAGGCGWTRAMVPVLARLNALGSSADAKSAMSIDGTETDEIVDALQPLITRMSEWLHEAPDGGLRRSVDDALGACRRLIEIAGLRQRDPAAWVSLVRNETTGCRLEVRCVAPAAILREHWESVPSAVLFSATLQPFDLQARSLGLQRDSRAVTIDCPYPADRRLVLRVDGIDQRARARQSSLDAVVGVVRDLVSARAGNYLLFAPAFSYLEQLEAALLASLPDVEVIRQHRTATEQERVRFTDRLKEVGAGPRIALLVAGGLYGEALDLPGDQCIGVIVAGLPMPAPDIERGHMQRYHGAAGFDVSYRMPAITRMLQAAGRVIRDEADAGIICLIDARLAAREYHSLLSERWDVEAVDGAEVGLRARAFWASLREPHALTTRRTEASHAQDQDHLHHRAGDGELFPAPGAACGGHECRAPEHVACGS